jgi:ribose transport system ATP-binding protein
VGRGLTGGSALSVRHVSKVFGGVVALDDVALDVAAGEVHALIGVNGSGKSTLIKVLTGFHAPEPGAEMELWGNPVALPVRGHVQHGIAVLHQQTGLVDELTVKESVGWASATAPARSPACPGGASAPTACGSRARSG